MFEYVWCRTDKHAVLLRYSPALLDSMTDRLCSGGAVVVSWLFSGLQRFGGTDG
jgi:hypothetical protein